MRASDHSVMLFSALLLLAHTVAALGEYGRPRPSPDLPLDAFPPNTDCVSSTTPCGEQVHIALGGHDEMVVTFLSGSADVDSTVEYWGPDKQIVTAHGSADAYSQSIFWNDWLAHPPMGNATVSESQILDLMNTSSWAVDPNTGEHTDSWAEPTQVKWYTFGDYRNPAMYYNSPVVHRVHLKPLAPGVTYQYRVNGDRRTFAFTMPPRGGAAAAYPLTFGLLADVGQTAVSRANLERVRADLAAAHEADGHAGVVLLGGDLSYADGYGWRWDSFGRMAEPLFSAFPVLTTVGNHETGPEQMVPYNARYPMPSRSSRSVSNLWWSRDIGPVHVISLCAYADAASDSLQYAWLKADLAAVDRAATPWLVVMTHVPWYSSSSHHFEESELMRRSMEPLLRDAGVDLVVNGHVHAYERTAAVYDFKRDPCGPVYLVVGDAGNREGAALPYREPRPVWSEFREGSFGVAQLRFHNATHARYEWRRSACESSTDPGHITFNATCESIAGGHIDNSNFSHVTSDATWLVRRDATTAARCAARSPKA